AKQEYESLKSSLIKSLNIMLIIIIPLTFLFLTKSSDIIKVVYERGAFGNEAALLTSQAFFFYSIGMIAVAMREVISRAFYSLKDTKTPTINAVITLICNIILNIVLAKYLGVGGIALATSLSAILSV